MRAGGIGAPCRGRHCVAVCSRRMRVTWHDDEDHLGALGLRARYSMRMATGEMEVMHVWQALMAWKCMAPLHGAQG